MIHIVFNFTGRVICVLCSCLGVKISRLCFFIVVQLLAVGQRSMRWFTDESADLKAVLSWPGRKKGSKMIPEISHLLGQECHCKEPHLKKKDKYR